MATLIDDHPSLGGTVDVTPGASTSGAPRATVQATIGRYRLIEEIGAGGMGRVMRAHDPELDRDVALKLLRRAPGASAQARLVREAQAMAQLSHDNVCQVFDVVIEDDLVCVAMELIEGVTLRRWLEPSRTEAQILAVFVAAGRGLSAAHAAGVVHRDFKPANVMVEERDDQVSRVCVLDFGLARAMADDPSLPSIREAVDIEASSSHSSIGAEPLTRAGSVMGTPAYMAPEQHRGQTAGSSTDQYALCVSLYEALAQARPFAGETIYELAAHKLDLELAAPLPARIPQRVRDAIVRGLAPDPSDRWPSIPELLEQLQPRPRRARWPWVAGLGASVALTTVALSSSAAVDCDRIAEQQGWLQPETVDRAADAFARADPEAGTAAFEQVRPKLVTHAQAWVEARATACTGQDGLDPALVDQRAACLHEQRRRALALMNVLAKADASVLPLAQRAADALEDPARCSDPDVLARPEGDTEDSETRQAQEASRDRLARADALISAGRYLDAAQDARAVVTEANAQGWSALAAEAGFELGQALGFAGRFVESEKALEESFFVAAQIGDVRGGFLAADALVFIVGESLSRPDDAMVWGERARERLDQMPGAEFERARLEHSLGAVLTEDHPAQAQEHLERAIEIITRVRGPRARELGVAYSNLGRAKSLLDDHAGALAAYRHARTHLASTVGPEHPQMAVVRAGIGDALFDAKDYAAAVQELEEALALLEASLPPEHVMFSMARAHLGLSLLELGRHAEAIEALEASISGFSELEGYENHSTLWAALGRARLEAGQAEPAVSALSRAVRELDAPDQTEARGQARFDLARAQWQSGQHDDGRASAQLAHNELVASQTSTIEVDAWLAKH